MDEPDDDEPAQGEPEPGIDVNAFVEAAAAEIATQTRAHPLRTLGVAFAVGYVLGGGLPRFAVRMGTAALVRAGGRLALAAVPWSRLVESVSSPAAAPNPVAKTKPPKNGHARASTRRS